MSWQCQDGAHNYVGVKKGSRGTSYFHNVTSLCLFNLLNGTWPLSIILLSHNVKELTSPLFLIIYTLYSLSVLSLAKSLQLILEISATYRLVSYLLAAYNWLICRLCTQWFPITVSIQVPWDGVFVIIFFRTMYNKTIIRFGFYDILNNQSLGKCYQPRPSVRLTTLTLTLIIPDITKTSSTNNYYRL